MPERRRRDGSTVWMNEWTDEKHEALVAWAGEGKSATQIASLMLGLGMTLTRSAVIGRCSRNGVKLSGSHPLHVNVRYRAAVASGVEPTPEDKAAHAASQRRKVTRKARANAKAYLKLHPDAAPPQPRGPSRHVPDTRTDIATSPPPCGGVALVDLMLSHCRFPYGEGVDTVFCGADKQAGSYCHAHARVVFRPPSKPQHHVPEHRDRRSRL